MNSYDTHNNFIDMTIPIVDFPGSSVVKESACNAGDSDSVPGLGRAPGGGHGNPLQYFCLEKPHGQRSLVGNSPEDHKESDMTEARLSMCSHRGLPWWLSGKESAYDVGYLGLVPGLGRSPG